MEDFAVDPGARGFPAVAVYRNLKLFVFDVDGVLTDGRIALDANGVESKFFDVRDGSGMTLLQKAGLEVALLTGRSSPVVDFRARELHLPPERVRQGAKRKRPAFEELLAAAGVSAAQTCFMGDDLIDLPALEIAGLACCPANAHPEVVKICHVVARQPGGRGAARAVCEHALKQRADGLWQQAVARYLGRA